MCFIVYETQSMIHCTDIPHGFAKGGLHPTLQELAGLGASPGWFGLVWFGFIYTPSHSKIWAFSMRFEAEPNGDS
jgi:hypothetical protein